MSNATTFSPYFLKSILNLLLVDQDYCDKFFPLLNPEHFNYQDKNFYILAKAIWKLTEKYKVFPSDDILIEEIFVQKGRNIDLFDMDPTTDELDALEALLISILEETPNKTYVEENTIRVLKLLSIHKVFSNYKKSLQDGTVDTEEFVQDVFEATTISDPIYLGDNLFNDLERRTENRLKHPIAEGMVTFGIEAIAEHLENGGLPPGSLAVWLAATNGGKTSGLIFTAKEAAMVDKHNVLYVSAELTADMIKQRFDANITGIEIKKIRKQAQKVKDLYLKSPQYMALSKRIQIVEVPMGTYTVRDLESIVERLEKKEFRTNLLVVDYADHLKGLGRQEDGRHEINSVYRDLKQLAFKKHLVVWTASQMNDAGTAESEKKAGLLSVRHVNESRAKIHLSDFCVGIARTQEEKDAGIARVVILKNRLGSGDGFTVRIFPDFYCSRFYTGRSELTSVTDIEAEIEGLDKNAVQSEAAFNTDDF